MTRRKFFPTFTKTLGKAAIMEWHLPFLINAKTLQNCNQARYCWNFTDAPGAARRASRMRRTTLFVALSEVANLQMSRFFYIEYFLGVSYIVSVSRGLFFRMLWPIFPLKKEGRPSRFIKKLLRADVISASTSASPGDSVWGLASERRVAVASGRRNECPF